MARRKDERPIYGQVPLPQPTKETAERQLRKRQLRQPPALAAVIPDVDKSEMKERAERHAFKKQLRQPPALLEPLPQGQRYRMFKVAWGGLNKTNEIDTGQMSDASNIDMGELPCIVPCLQPKEIGHEAIDIEHSGYYPYQSGDVIDDTDCHKNGKTPLGLWSSEDALVAIYSGQTQTGNTKNNRGFVEILDIDDDLNGTVTLRGIIDHETFDALDVESRKTIPPHMVTGFNTYSDDPYNITEVTVTKRMLVAPSFVSLASAGGVKVLDWEVNGKPSSGSYIEVNRNSAHTRGYGFSGKYDGMVVRLIDVSGANPEYFWVKVKNFYEIPDGGTKPRLTSVQYWRYSTGENLGAPEISGAPLIDHMTVHQSRLFSVGNNRVYASGYNNYADYTLDTANEINESHAWMSTSQSNPKAAGDFTAIATYGNHVLLFREKFLQEVYGTKNPFRIVDIGEFGTIDQRSICEINGVLYFVGNDGVYAYSGGMPRDIGSNLGVNKFTYAVAGRCRYDYYLYCEDATNTGRLFVYNTRNRTWTEHSTEPFGDGESLGIPNSRIIGFANKSEGLYALTQGGRIYCVDNTNDTVLVSDESAMEQFSGVSWWFETEFITRHNLTSSSSPSAMAYSNVNIKHLKSIQLLADVAVAKVESDDFDYATDAALQAAWVPQNENTNVCLPSSSGAMWLSQTNALSDLAFAQHAISSKATASEWLTIKFKFSVQYDPATSKTSVVGISYGSGASSVFHNLITIGGASKKICARDSDELLDSRGRPAKLTLDGLAPHIYAVEISRNGNNIDYAVTDITNPGAPERYTKTITNSIFNSSRKIDNIYLTTNIPTSYTQNESEYNGYFEIKDFEILVNSQFKVYTLYDGEKFDSSMTPVYDSNGATGRVTARIKLRNTAHYGFKLRVQGTGYVKLHEVELYVEDGGTPYLGTGDTAADGSEWL